MPGRTFAVLAVATAIATLLADPATAKAVWVPTLADGSSTSCGNAYKHGGTLLAQCGAPTTSQIAVNAEVLKRKDGSANGFECKTEDDGRRSVNPDFEPKLQATECPNDGYTNQVPEEFIAITDHSISLVPKQGFSDHNRQSAISKQWPGSWSGMSSTNWGGTSGNALAQAYNTRIGDSLTNDENENAPKSSLGQGYISYFFKKDPNDESPALDFPMRNNQFFIGMPGGTFQYVNGCPNIKPGDTYSQTNGDACPEKNVNVGEYKFSILGTLSGTMINSAHSEYDVNLVDTWPAPSNDTYRDMAKYTTMLYRSTLDVGNIKSDMTVVLEDGSERPFSDFDSPNNGIDISGGKLKIGDMEVVFEPNLSMGKYTLTKDDVAADLPGGTFPCNSNQMDDCVIDYTGFDGGLDAFPLGANTKVKKQGKGCKSEDHCNAWKKFADTQNMDMNAATASYEGCTQCDQGVATGLDDEPGALKLDISQVVKMKITMRKSKGCPARPSQPNAHDPFGQGGTSWPSLPTDHDCPWWYLATTNFNGLKWAANEDMIPGGYKSLTTCALNSKDCYLIDFHIPLEVNGQRTALGNVKNDQSLGWQEGSFFMYDPEVRTPKLPEDEAKDEDSSGGILSQCTSLWLVLVAVAWYVH